VAGYLPLSLRTTTGGRKRLAPIGSQRFQSWDPWAGLPRDVDLGQPCEFAFVQLKTKRIEAVSKTKRIEAKTKRIEAVSLWALIRLTKAREAIPSVRCWCSGAVQVAPGFLGGVSWGTTGSHDRPLACWPGGGAVSDAIRHALMGPKCLQRKG